MHSLNTFNKTLPKITWVDIIYVIKLKFVANENMQFFDLDNFFCHVTIDLQKDKQNSVYLSKQSQAKLDYLI